MIEGEDDKATYRVVTNHEEQYSIWPVDRELPLGWTEDGTTGTKQACLEHIDRVWTDMRPLSLRREMAEMDARADGTETEHRTQLAETEPGPADPRDDLVGYLSEGDHPVEACLSAEATLERLKERIGSGYIRLRFTDTRGGTELGIQLDPEATSLEMVDRPEGRVHLEGDLTLNFVQVRCVADIDLPSMKGKGHLVPTGEG